MKAFIVYAHPEPKSFNAAMRDRAVATLRLSGHDVLVSDLYEMNFNPVASDRDFKLRRFKDSLHYDREQKYSVHNNSLKTDIATEIEKVQWCDLLILQFPLWWFSVPAIMKGWVDRVFVNGVAYGAGRRYDEGGFRGRKAMVVTSTGAAREMLQPRGLLGELDVVLWPIQNGILSYTGFEVLQPFVAHNVAFVDQLTRNEYLAAYEADLRNIKSRKPLFFHSLSDFGPDWKLRPGVDARAVGQKGRDV